LAIASLAKIKSRPKDQMRFTDRPSVNENIIFLCTFDFSVIRPIAHMIIGGAAMKLD